MATLKELETALVNADRAGDMDAARKLAAVLSKARQDPANQIPDTAIASTLPDTPEPTLGQQAIGGGEAGLTLATGATGGLVGGVGGALKGLAQEILSGRFGTADSVRMVEQAAAQGAQAMTYAPRRQVGQDITQTIGGALQALPPVIPVVGQVGALGQVARSAAPLVAATAQRAAVPVAQAAQKVGQSVQRGMQAVMPAPETTFGGSVGAAGADLSQMRIEAAQSLPVPVDLTMGAARRDAGSLAFEKEQMKSAEFGAPLRQRAEDNNRQILANVEAFFDETGANSPDIVSAGRSVTAALSSGLAQAKTKVRSEFAKADAAGELRYEVSLSKLIDHLNKSEPESDSAPLLKTARRMAVDRGIAKEVNGVLVPVERAQRNTLMNAPAESGVSLKLAEQYRQAINRNTDFEPTNIRQATIIKGLIDDATEGAGGDIYRRARSLRREQAERYENRAIVADLIQNRKGMSDPKVAIDKVFNKTILGGSPDEIKFLKRILQTGGDDGKQAWKELQGATVNHIRDAATGGMNTDSAGRPLVSTAKLHQAVNTLDKNGRLDIVFGKQGAAKMRLLNEVVKYVNTVPPGTLINTSGTAATLMAALAEAGAMGAMSGLPVPVVSGLRQISQMVKDRKLRAKITAALNAEGK